MRRAPRRCATITKFTVTIHSNVALARARMPGNPELLAAAIEATLGAALSPTFTAGEAPPSPAPPRAAPSLPDVDFTDLIKRRIESSTPNRCPTSLRSACMNPQYQKMMKQVQEMQKKMAKAQEELANETVQASAGGGMVTVVDAPGSLEVREVTIKPEAVDPDDVEMLQDLVTAATNEALRAAQDLASTKLGGATGGLDLPNIPGMF